MYLSICNLIPVISGHILISKGGEFGDIFFKWNDYGLNSFDINFSQIKKSIFFVCIWSPFNKLMKKFAYLQFLVVSLADSDNNLKLLLIVSVTLELIVSEKVFYFCSLHRNYVAGIEKKAKFNILKVLSDFIIVSTASILDFCLYLTFFM